MAEQCYTECCLSSVSFKLSVTHKPFMLSVIMLNVVMLLFSYMYMCAVSFNVLRLVLRIYIPFNGALVLARVFVHGKLFQPSIMLVGKDISLP